ncbi:hypothetical protein EHQ46_16485 [Leptospira yanagawae]|uniref:DUF4846 domain-containing protein n=1 Tax=Leptospira yanagawae TaxID=293069 RepID=A0ABY2LXK4_9LEPT|nr:DUF4846 domain-containing protein [Leptospira yanagawae]TGL17467.1 hypothetical protein EHQ46_16485 [Leptospira yanagawae]
MKKLFDRNRKTKLTSQKKWNFFFLLVMSSLSFVTLPFIPLFADTIQKRFTPPNGYLRVDYPKDSFASYLQNFPLKPEGSPVLLYNGNQKQNQVHVAVLHFPLLKRDLIQCADAVMKLRAEYFYAQKKYDQILFKISNGMEVPFHRFAKGDRVVVKGNKTSWKLNQSKKGTNRDVFEEYLQFIYSYAGTISLKSELIKKSLTQLEPGDVWIEAGSPGHVVMVVDKAIGKDGQMVFLLAQSYMPSQEMHILKSEGEFSPWFTLPKGNNFQTPEWEFPAKEFYGFLK